MRRLLITVTLLLIRATICPAAPVPQTRPWRIAVAGGQAVAVLGGGIPGYLSLLASHGLPRVRIDEAELVDLDRLRQFDVVIAAWANHGSPQAMQALEQFASEGGIVIIEGWPLPSTQAVAGKRLGPARVANMRFVASDSVISQGLPELGVIRVAGPEAGAIIPEAGSRAVVLARYTDEDTPEDCRGHFRDGDQGAPAVLLIPYGKGQIVYSGPSLFPNLSRPDQVPEPLLCRVLNVLSQGEVRDRLFAGNVDRADLVTLATSADAQSTYPAPSGAVQPAPKGFEVLEEASRLQDFCLSGKLPAAGQARVLLGYWSSRDTSEAVFTSGKLTLSRVRDGKAVAPRSVTLPRPGGAITITRRASLLTITADGRLVYNGCLGPPRQGALAVMGLQDPAYQPLGPVHFADDFMREAGFSGEWEAQSGTWQVVASEGKAETGANPFNYQASASPEAISLTGEWFWSDYACGVSAQGSGEAVGLIANYASKDDYLLLKLTFSASDPRASRLQLIQRQAGAETVVAETTVPVARTDWHRLELRTSRGRLQGWLNGQMMLQGAGPPAASGRVGLYCQQGAAAFDDVKVEPWVASPPGTAPRAEEMLVGSGAWATDSKSQVLSATGAGGARLLLPWPEVKDCQASVKVKVGQAEAGGLFLRGRDTSWVLVALGRSGNQLRLRAYRQGTPGAVLAETSVAGSPAAWHVLSARYSGPRLRISVDDKLLADVLDGGSAGGAVGLYARGAAAAQFQALEAWAEPASDHLADEVTPPFAGVIDRHTWAGRSGAWTPDPARLDCLWHLGYYPGAVRLEVGVHPQRASATTTLLHLSPRGQPESGYTLTAHRTWAAGTVDLTLAFGGRTVARGTIEVAAGKPYAIGFERSEADLLATVNRKAVLTWRDRQPRPELCRLGLDNAGQLVYADDVAVSSPLVHDYTFETAPTDWTVESGTWKVSSRWSCSPGWSWFGGQNPDGPALVATRQRYVGDMDVVAYFGAKMMSSGGGSSEKLTDVHLGCGANDTRADSGYHFVVGGNDNTKTVLLRDGKEVASSPFRIAQALIHNDWLRLTLKRRGAEVALWVWDSRAISWTDPEPLGSGRIALGTERNGILVPRVSIYGPQAESGSVPVTATSPATPVKPAASPKPPAKPGPLPLLTFTTDQPKPEFGGDWGLWPQQEGCQGTATFVPGQDAEGGQGGAMKVDYTIKATPRSFSLWLTSGNNPVNLTAYDRFVLCARGEVPSLTLVVKDRSATDPDATRGIADYVVKGLTDKWQRFEIPFKGFKARGNGGQLDWRAINHIGIAMVAPQNAPSGTFWVDNLRAEAGPGG
jgi:hypothetical protein